MLTETFFMEKILAKETLMSLGFLKQRVWGMHMEVGINSSLCSKSPAWHLPSHPMHFTLPREGIGIISQQASEQTDLGSDLSSLIIKLQHPCVHAVEWVGGRGGQPP